MPAQAAPSTDAVFAALRHAQDVADTLPDPHAAALLRALAEGYGAVFAHHRDRGGRCVGCGNPWPCRDRVTLANQIVRPSSTQTGDDDAHRPAGPV